MRPLWTVLGALGVALASAGVAAAQGDAPSTPTTAVNFAVSLAPIFAAALVIERSLEAFFNFLEASLLTVIARLAMGADWLGWATLEIENANGMIRTTSAELRRLMAVERQQPPVSAQAMAALTADKQTLMGQLDQAESWLRDADQRLQDVVKTPGYRRLKQVAALGLGVVSGVVLAGLTRLDIFQMLGLVSAPSIFGFLLTGLIIGTGSAPVHSLIDLLQQFANTVNQTRAWLNGKALESAAQALITAQGSQPPARPVVSEAQSDGAPAPAAPVTLRTVRKLERLIDD